MGRHAPVATRRRRVAPTPASRRSRSRPCARRAVRRRRRRSAVSAATRGLGRGVRPLGAPLVVARRPASATRARRRRDIDVATAEQLGGEVGIVDDARRRGRRAELSARRGRGGREVVGVRQAHRRARRPCSRRGAHRVDGSRVAAGGRSPTRSRRRRRGCSDRGCSRRGRMRGTGRRRRCRPPCRAGRAAPSTHGRAACRVGVDRLRHAGGDQARRHGVDADAVAAPLQRHLRRSSSAIAAFDAP